MNDLRMALARDVEATEAMQIGGLSYCFTRRSEAHRDVSPFAGLLDHAKWLHFDDLTGLLRRRGFADTRVVSDRDERNGRRATVFAFRDRIQA